MVACSAKRFRFGHSTHWLPYAARLSARKVSETSRMTLRLLPCCLGGRSQWEPLPVAACGTAPAPLGRAANPARAPALLNKLRLVVLLMESSCVRTSNAGRAATDARV